MESVDGSLIRDVLVGLGVFLPGLAIFIFLLRAVRIIGALVVTLEGVDRQLGALGTPVAQTLAHVSGIADTADMTLARLGGVVGQLETVAGAVVKTSSVAQDALTPSIVNLGSTLTGVTAGLRRLARGKNGGTGG
jgi:hypothetical protein